MASLEITPELTQPGRWHVASDTPAAVAAVPDAVVQVLGFTTDVSACWALHASEQDGARDQAYVHERQELGPAATVEVLELLRPRQPNVVWVDRFHLLALGAPAAAASRLLGLYVDGEGQLVTYLYQPVSTPAVSEFISQAPHSGGSGWDDPSLVAQCRLVVRADKGRPNQVTLLTPHVLAQQVGQALQQLAAHVAHW